MRVGRYDVKIDSHAWDRHAVSEAEMLDHVLSDGEGVASRFESVEDGRATVKAVLRYSQGPIERWLSSRRRGERYRLVKDVDHPFMGIVADGMSVRVMETDYVVAILECPRGTHITVRTAYPDIERHGYESSADLSDALAETDAYKRASDMERWLLRMRLDMSITLPEGTSVAGREIVMPLSTDDFAGTLRIGESRAKFLDGNSDVIATMYKDRLPQDVLIQRAFPNAYAVVLSGFAHADSVEEARAIPVLDSLVLDASAPDEPEPDADAVSEDDVAAMIERKARRKAAYERRTSKAKGSRRQKKATKAKRPAKQAKSKPRPKVTAHIDHDPNFESAAHQALFTALATQNAISTTDGSSVLIPDFSDTSTGALLEAHPTIDAIRRAEAEDDPADRTDIILDDGFTSVVDDVAQARSYVAKLARTGNWTLLRDAEGTDEWLDERGFKQDVLPRLEFRLRD